MTSGVLEKHLTRCAGALHAQDMPSRPAGTMSGDPRRPGSGGAGSSVDLAEIDSRLHALQSYLKAAKASCDLVH